MLGFILALALLSWLFSTKRVTVTVEDKEPAQAQPPVKPPYLPCTAMFIVTFEQVVKMYAAVFCFVFRIKGYRKLAEVRAAFRKAGDDAAEQLRGYEARYKHTNTEL